MATPTLPRSSGILLHPTCLPGPFGIGDLGPVAFRWVETLAAMKQSWWQILPLGPTGAGDSPYQSLSAFAGSINLLSPELLARDGLVSPDLWAGEHFADHEVQYDRVTPFKTKLLRAAWDGFRAGKGSQLKPDFEAYCATEAGWLDGFALFAAIRDALGGANLLAWPPDVLRRNPVALAELEKKLVGEVQLHKFGQFLFDRQWTALKDYARERKIKIVGDAPIFVALDSSDVWAHPDEFLLDHDRNPTVVAGVPPDYFAADGQHWGNPIYNWDRMAATGYVWWCNRVSRQLKQVDLIRLDHFRGFCQAWHIPATAKTAREEEGARWVNGPGLKLFERLRTSLGGLPLIAEDLGVITPDVEELRDHLALPGMRVIQFALGGPDNLHWPHNYIPNCVCYTGTHDNDTVTGWFRTLGDHDKHTVGFTLGKHLGDVAWDFIREAWASVAVIAVAPLQDVLSLGSEARMNRPGIATGNWRWRFWLDQFRGDLIHRLAELTTIYNRVPAEPKPARG
ncbi:MAG: 4-alpha-glucanotransferase [Gemmataceae bacterium]|nr:4-alpha-glucanotransferase [Gemmataceae bacterium]